MEGRNGQYYEESPVESQESTSSRSSAPTFGSESLTINKFKQSLPSTNIFRIVSDPSSLTITKVPSGGKSDILDQMLRKSNSGRADPMDSRSLTITKVTNYTKTDSSDQTSRNIKDLSTGSISNNDLSSDTSKMDDDSYDSASFYSVNGDSNLNLDNSNPDEVRAFECDECGRAFKRSDHLRKHKTTHSGLKPYECDQCDKKYTQSSSLKIHKLTHSQANRFACDTCPRTFTQSSTLNVHKKVHVTSKMYECPTCGKGYNHSANLAVHQRTHAEDFKFFTCDVCGKKFTQKGNLNTHKMIHSNIRPYKCNVCEKEFVQKNNFLLHQKTHEKNSTSGHVVVTRKPVVTTTVNPATEEATESYSDNDEEDDTYLDDFVVGTMQVNDSNLSKTITSTPEKSSAVVKDVIPKSSKETNVVNTKNDAPKVVRNIASSVPFVCMDCNNKPFSDKCRLSNHKMYVLF